MLLLKGFAMGMMRNFVMSATLTSYLLSAPAVLGALENATRPSTAPAGPIPAEKLKADLDFMLATLKEVHPNLYAYVPEAQAAKAFDNVRAALDRPMTREAFYQLIAPAVASFKNGHTFVQPVQEEFVSEVLAGRAKVFPISIQFDNNAVILRQFHGEGALPLGGEILSVNGKNASEVFGKYASCTPGENRAVNPQMMERSTILWLMLWLDYGQDRSLELRIRDRGGRTDTYAVEPVLFNKVKQYGEPTDRGNLWEYSYLEGPKCGLITIKGLDDREGFEQFLKKAFSDLSSKGAGAVIVDVRDCPGGDSNVGDALLDYLTDRPFKQFESYEIKILPRFYGTYLPARGWPKEKVGTILREQLPMVNPKSNPLRFQGQKIVLIGRRSFSSTSSFAAAIKHFGIATLVGEETGDPTDCYGDCIYFMLPNSKLQVSVAIKHFVCAGDVGGGRGAIPDHKIRQTPEDLAAGKDTVLDYALDVLNNRAAGER